MKPYSNGELLLLMKIRFRQNNRCNRKPLTFNYEIPHGLMKILISHLIRIVLRHK